MSRDALKMVDVDPRPTYQIMNGRSGPAMAAYAEMHCEAMKSSGEIAQAAGLELREFVGGMVAIGLRYLAWSMLSAAKHGSAEFDPVEFGKAAERAAREVAPLYAQKMEMAGASRQ